MSGGGEAAGELARAGVAQARRGRPAGLVPASAALVATAFGAGLGLGRPWTTWLLVVVAIGQGFLGGHHLRAFWRGGAREEIFGAGGRYLAFLGAVAFTAVEAHAVGAGIEGGAPRSSVALLLLPVALAGWALRSAVSLRGHGEGGDEGGGREAEHRNVDA